MKILLDKGNSKKLKVIVILSAIFLVIVTSIFFVNRLNQFSEIEISEAANACPPAGASFPEGGCHYAKPGVFGQICPDCASVEGKNPDHVHSETSGLPRDAKCNISDTAILDVSRQNTCGFTHTGVCVQKEWTNDANGCKYSADWECCNDPSGQTADKFIVKADGTVVAEQDFYTGEGMDGRWEINGCSSIEGWAGTKTNIQDQVDIFFTVGGSVTESGILFNPNIKADESSEDGSLICDFLDNKDDGPIEACTNCDGNACNHRFRIDLNDYTDSPIFNNGQLADKIYAYAYFNGEVSALTDVTNTVHELSIGESCGGGWDGLSDVGPEGITNEDISPGNTGNTSEGASNGELICNGDIDYNFDSQIGIEDFVVFAGLYNKCNNDQDITSNACRRIDLNCDENLDLIILDFTQGFMPLYRS